MIEAVFVRETEWCAHIRGLGKGRRQETHKTSVDNWSPNNARECLDIRNFIFAVTKTKLNIPSGCDTNAIVYLKQIIAGLRQESAWQQDILLGGGGVCFLGGGMISGRLASGDQKLTLEVVPLPPPPPQGGNPLYKPYCSYRYMPNHRVGICVVLVWKGV